MIGAVVSLLLGVLSWRWFVDPTDTVSWDPELAQRWPAGRADAVVMFGGAGPRFDAAADLVRAGVAPTLVVSDPNDRPIGDAATPFQTFCTTERGFEAICFDPEPRTTRGESRYVARLADARSWRRLVLVTSADQARRARMLLERCWSGEVVVVVVDSSLNTLGRVAYEWAATARALFVRRSC